MNESDLDRKKLEDMRNNLKNIIKEKEEDRKLGVKYKRNNSDSIVKSELNSSNYKKSNSKSKKSKSSSKNNGKIQTKKGKKTNSAKKKSSNKVKNKSKKNRKNISITLMVLTVIICVVYSVFGKEYIEDMQREDFIEMIEPMAADVYEEYGVYPSIVISRAAVESNWGKSQLSKDAFNLFGIKADNSWSGKKINMKTKEGYNDIEDAYFRKYKSYKESICDYGSFLKENKRYEKAGLFKAKNAKEQAQILEDAGYATKENSKGELVYADVLIDFMNRYELEKIDAKYVKNE